MLRTFNIPLTWGELVRRTLKEFNADDCLNLAAQLAYYFLLALVPSILCIVALTSFLPPNVLQDVIGALGRFAPQAILDILREQMKGAAEGDTGLLTFGLAMALWSSSAAMVSITGALNRAYDIEEARPWWKVRLTAITLTLGVALFVVVAFGLVMVGPTLGEQLAARMGLGPAFALSWKVLQWPVVFALMVVGVGLIYTFGPDAEQQWEWSTPGAVMATMLWLIASLGFKVYIANFADYSTYGSIGGVIVLMLWFYITALAVLIGAEMNAEIEHASSYGKDPGEKVPGEKKKLGAVAKRAYEERQKAGGVTEPGPHERPVGAGGGPALRPAPASYGAYAVLGIGLLTSLFKKKSGAESR